MLEAPAMTDVGLAETLTDGFKAGGVDELDPPQPLRLNTTGTSMNKANFKERQRYDSFAHDFMRMLPSFDMRARLARTPISDPESTGIS
jgi:hypothetical protein